MAVAVTGPSLWIFRLAFAAALAVTTVAFVFFFWGLLDGTISSFNFHLWLMTIGLVTVVPVAGWVLRSSGRAKPAILVLSVLAVPGLLYGLFILLLVVLHPSWN